MPIVAALVRLFASHGAAPDIARSRDSPARAEVAVHRRTDGAGAAARAGARVGRRWGTPDARPHVGGAVRCAAAQCLLTRGAQSVPVEVRTIGAREAAQEVEAHTRANVAVALKLGHALGAFRGAADRIGAFGARAVVTATVTSWSGALYGPIANSRAARGDLGCELCARRAIVVSHRIVHCTAGEGGEKKGERSSFQLRPRAGGQLG